MSSGGVLVVDDMADARFVVSHIIQSRGLPVYEAGSGQEALDLMRAHRGIETVFVDLQLPDMSGFDLLRKLSPMKAERSFRLCALTGRTDDETRDAALEAGADYFFAKPLHPHALLHRLFALDA